MEGGHCGAFVIHFLPPSFVSAQSQESVQSNVKRLYVPFYREVNRDVRRELVIRVVSDRVKFKSRPDSQAQVPPCQPRSLHVDL